MNNKKLLKKVKSFYDKLDKLTRESKLSRSDIITALEMMKLDIMLNDGLIIINGKVGPIKK